MKSQLLLLLVGAILLTAILCGVVLTGLHLSRSSGSLLSTVNQTARTSDVFIDKSVEAALIQILTSSSQHEQSQSNRGRRLDSSASSNDTLSNSSKAQQHNAIASITINSDIRNRKEVAAHSTNNQKKKSISSSALVTCHKLLQDVHGDPNAGTHRNRRKAQWDPNEQELFARYTKLYPQFWISLHNFEYDKVRYGTLHWGKYYEQKLSLAFTEVLQSYNDAKKITLVIDVGGNIGWFSLLSAAMGHNVHVFEPNIINVIRLCESQCLNGWVDCHTERTTLSAMYYPSDTNDNYTSPGAIQIRRLGLKDEDGRFWLSQTPGSLSSGAGRIGATKAQRDSIPVQVTTLDQMAIELGWLDSTETIISILKVDVEGLEYDVFRGGRNLLESKKVKNIFMEGNVGTPELTAQFVDLVRKFQSVGYVVYKMGGSNGPANDISYLPYSDNAHVNFTDGLLFGCRGYEKANHLQCNIWWKLKDEVAI